MLLDLPSSVMVGTRMLPSTSGARFLGGGVGEGFGGGEASTVTVKLCSALCPEPPSSVAVTVIVASPGIPELTVILLPVTLTVATALLSDSAP